MFAWQAMIRNFRLSQLGLGILVIALLAGAGELIHYEQHIELESSLAEKIGMQIWRNECAGKLEGLTSWNEGEEFASLGIGHSIWYPEGREGPFKESFPSLLAFFKSNGVHLPLWLDEAKGCPWQTREEFQQAQSQQSLKELRDLLSEHVDLQILFMVQRLQNALPVIINHAPESMHRQLIYQFYRLASTPGGVYTLLDYLNFKGEGTGDKESYQGHRWGLLQVLEKMQGRDPGTEAIGEFVEAAKEVLAARVAYAPVERKEERWLKGWYNRLDTYQSISEL